MPLALERAGGDALIRLPEAVTVNCVSELHRLFLEAFGARQSVRMDFEHTAELDACAIQLLYRACQSAGSSGLSVVVAGTLPEPVEKAFQEAGLDPFRRALLLLGK